MKVTYDKSKTFVNIDGKGQYSIHDEIVKDFLKNGGVIELYEFLTPEEVLEKIKSQDSE